jgi:hypothetical protein
MVAAAAAIAAVSTCVLYSQSASAQDPQYPGPLPYEVFLDTFSNGSAIDNPSVTPTSDSTDYAMTSSKYPGVNATMSTGDLEMELPSSSSAYLEAAAVFTTSPVVLQNTGDAIDFIMEFTDTANLTPTTTQNQIGIGLFNSGGVYPITTNINGGGTFTTSGGVQSWVGYNSQIYGHTSGGSTTSKMNSRPGQTATAGSQDLLFNDTASGTYDSPRGSNLVNGSSSSTLVLNNGSQYTEDFQIQITGAGTLLVTNTVFQGTGTGGTVLYTYGGTSNFTGSVSFDSLAFGFLEKSSLVETQDISEIEITTTIPEPSTWMLLAASLPVVLAVVSRRRRS